MQLTPPGSACSVVLGTGITEMPPGSQKGVQVVVADAAAGPAGPPQPRRAGQRGRRAALGIVRHLRRPGRQHLGLAAAAATRVRQAPRCQGPAMRPVSGPGQRAGSAGRVSGHARPCRSPEPGDRGTQFLHLAGEFRDAAPAVGCLAGTRRSRGCGAPRGRASRDRAPPWRHDRLRRPPGLAGQHRRGHPGRERRWNARVTRNGGSAASGSHRLRREAVPGLHAGLGPAVSLPAPGMGPCPHATRGVGRAGNKWRPKSGQPVSGADHKAVSACATPARPGPAGEGASPAAPGPPRRPGICGRPERSGELVVPAPGAPGAGTTAHWNSREKTPATAAASYRRPGPKRPRCFGGSVETDFRARPTEPRAPGTGRRADDRYADIGRLLITCPDRPAIVAAVSSFLFVQRREHHRVTAVLHRSVRRKFLSPD